MNNEKTKFVRQVAKVYLVYTQPVFAVAYTNRDTDTLAPCGHGRP
jgi:hypothetical protein